MTSPISERTRRIRELAATAGLDAVGIVSPDAAPLAGPRLDRFLELGRHGDMAWLAARAGERRHPRALWPEVRSIVMAGIDYGPAGDPLALLGEPRHGNISVYARGRDYHDVLKSRLKALARAIHAEHGGAVKVFVDTAPVMEKPLAEAAGIGWQGKHSNLVSREFGSWLFLGAIFTDLELAPDAPRGDACGSCRACLDICPTDAFPAPRELDARRCISYLTIEHKGPIPHEFREAIGNRIYGCDDCLAVCPWNKFASRAAEAAFHARAELAAPELGDLAMLDDGAFRAVFAGSPIKRTGRDRFLRNVLIAIGNSGDPAFLPKVRARLADASPLVRGMAVRALGRLAPEEAFARAGDAVATESDAHVLDEWARVRSGAAGGANRTARPPTGRGRKSGGAAPR